MLHAGGERLGESFLTFFETAVGDVLAVVGDSAEDAVEASTDAIGEELVQSDGHGGFVGWWTRCKADCSCVEKAAYYCYATWVVYLALTPAC